MSAPVYLRAPVKLVAALDATVPYSKPMEEYILPDEEKIAAAGGGDPMSEPKGAARAAGGERGKQSERGRELSVGVPADRNRRDLRRRPEEDLPPQCRADLRHPGL